VKQNSTYPIKTAILFFESPEKSRDAFNKLGHILDRCGFEESVEKACPPNTKMIFGEFYLTQKFNNIY
jgi:hypothetical protein